MRSDIESPTLPKYTDAQPQQAPQPNANLPKGGSKSDALLRLDLLRADSVEKVGRAILTVEFEQRDCADVARVASSPLNAALPRMAMPVHEVLSDFFNRIRQLLTLAMGR